MFGRPEVLAHVYSFSISTAMRLAFRLVPGDGEIPADFASRLATLACRDSLWGFCKDFGLDHQGIADGSETAVRKLASLADVDTETLLRSAFLRISDDERYRYRGELLNRQNLARYRVRFCPACVAEDLDRHTFRREARPFRRGEWAINVIRTCNCHRLPLVDLPPEKSPKLCHDSSRAMARALPDLSRFLAQSVSRDPSPFEGYVRRRLSGERTSGWLDALPLYAALQLVGAVGGIEFSGAVGRPGQPDTDFAWESEAYGFALFDKGEAEILGFLERKQLNRSTDGRRGRPPAKLGRLYQWLSIHNGDPAYDPMRQLLFRVASGDPGKAVSGKSAERRHSIRTGSLAFGIHPKRLRRLLRDEGVIDKASERRTDDRVFFDAVAAERAIGSITDFVALSAACIGEAARGLSERSAAPSATDQP